MATATEKAYVVAKLDELEPAPLLAPGATDDGRQRFDVRRRFGITSFGTNAYRAPSEVDVIREHDEIAARRSRQEELYIVLNGAATFEIDGDAVEAPAGSLVLVQPTAKRKATAKDDGTTILASAARRARRTSRRRGGGGGLRGRQRGRLRDRAAKQLVVVEKRPDDPVAHFNAACFEARAGQADEAIEHLQRAVELNDRIKELIRTDEDLDSIREDPRFDALTK